MDLEDRRAHTQEDLEADSDTLRVMGALIGTQDKAVNKGQQGMQQLAYIVTVGGL